MTGLLGVEFPTRCGRLWSGRSSGVSVFKPGPPRRTPIHALRRIWHGPNYLLQITDPALRQTAREVQAEIERVKPEAVLSISGQCVTYLENPGFRCSCSAILLG